MALKQLIKTLLSAVLGITLIWGGPAHAAGTTPLALVPQVDSQGNAASGCLVYFFVAGTVATPQNAFADFGLTQSLGPVLSCDQAGRVPMHWLADGLIHVRLTDSAGLPIVDTTMQVLGPSSGGGGGGGTVDPTTILSTGDVKVKYSTGPLSGFVRFNGLTIGNAVSGATERANADTQAAFIYLYGVDPNLVVSGGRTGNALNDYNANKTLTLPDARGLGLGALADMGNTATTKLNATYFGASVTTLGSIGGSQSHSLLAAELAAHNHAVFLNDPGHTHTNNANSANSSSGTGGGGFTIPATSAAVINSATTGITVRDASGGGGNANQTASTGSGTAFATVPPMMLMTVYMKL